MTLELTDNIKKAIAKDVPLHDIVHGEVLNEIVNEQDIMLELGEDEQGSANYEYHRGYADAMQKVYGLIYALVFEQADQKKEVAHGN
jgi:hypothetical protein